MKSDLINRRVTCIPDSYIRRSLADGDVNGRQRLLRSLFLPVLAYGPVRILKQLWKRREWSCISRTAAVLSEKLRDIAAARCPSANRVFLHIVLDKT